MTAKSLILHIGDPKTGSSSIQEVLRNRLYDSDSITVDYPEQLNSFPLANSLWDKNQADNRKSRWSNLADWLNQSQADLAIVSAEQFFRVKPDILQATLDEFLPDYAQTIRIIAYVRPHANRLLGAYAQRTKVGLSQSDLQAFFETTKRENLLQFAPRFQRWRDVFGDRLTVRPVIREELRQGDVVTDFMDYALKGHPFKLRGVVEANPSLPVEYLAAVRDVQAVLKRNEIAVGTRHSVGDHLSRSLWRGGVKGTKLAIPTPLYQQIKAYCEPDAIAMDNAFFGRPLLANALEDAGKDVIPSMQDVKAKSYYSDESLQTLRQKARHLAALFKKRPVAWTVAFEREIGQRPFPNAERLSPPSVRAHVDKVNAVLGQLADLIAIP